MSRAYRISVSESISRIVRAEDGVSADLDLLPILAPERMQSLLATELERQGFVRQGSEGGADRMVRVDPDGVRIEVDLGAGTVHVSIEGERDVAVEGQREAWGAKPDDDVTKEAARRALRQQLEGQIDRKEQELSAELADKLEARLRELRGELDRAVTRVTQEALKERAAQIGEVREISEDPATGSLTIRVKLG